MDKIQILLPGPDDVSNLPTLQSNAQLQDSLLQSYRQIHLEVQSILMAIGVGLCIALMGFEETIKIRWLFGSLCVFFIFSMFLIWKLGNIVRSRGEDVNFWHYRILVAERSLDPEKRSFTLFKIKQKLARIESSHLEQFVNVNLVEPSELRILLDEGLTHTRKVLDLWLFWGLVIVWLMLLCTGFFFVFLN